MHINIGRIPFDVSGIRSTVEMLSQQIKGGPPSSLGHHEGEIHHPDTAVQGPVS